MTLDASAVNRIAQLGASEIGAFNRHVVINDESYVFDGSKFTRLDPENKRPAPLVNPLEVSSLRALVTYLKSGVDKVSGLIHVSSPTFVEVLGPVTGYTKQREQFIFAKLEEDAQPFGEWQTIEETLVWLRTRFVPTPDGQNLILGLGNVTDGNVKTSQDDGFSQQISVKVGATMAGADKVKSPVMLKPYRTFLEVDQPQSEFIARLQGSRDGFPRVAIFEADGGAWKNEAVAKVVAYLKGELPDWTVIG